MTELRKITKLSWRKFLDTEYGREGMLYLRERIPSVQASDPTSIIFNAGRAEGYKVALDMISEVISLEEQKETNIENQ